VKFGQWEAVTREALRKWRLSRLEAAMQVEKLAEVKVETLLPRCVRVGCEELAHDWRLGGYCGKACQFADHEDIVARNRAAGWELITMDHPRKPRAPRNPRYRKFRDENGWVVRGGLRK